MPDSRMSCNILFLWRCVIAILASETEDKRFIIGLSLSRLSLGNKGASRLTDFLRMKAYSCP